MALCLFLNSFIFQVLMCLVLANETSSYEKILLENAKVCSLKDDGDSTAVVRLGKEEWSSKIVTQSTYLERWAGRYIFSCNFLVKAPSNYGVYAVIQVLNFRRNETTGLCKDYVEFEIPQNPLKLFFKRDRIAKKFCGKIIASETYLSGIKDLDYDDSLRYSSVAENGFVAKNGLIHVTVHVAKERLEANERLDISIAFTSFKQDCKKRDKSIQCKDCEWIWEGLHLDKIQNCPYTSCLDEDFCKDLAKNDIRNRVSSGTGTKVSIGAVTTIILVLLIFACCVWMSRRLQLWCFDPSSSSQSRMEMNANQRTSRLEDNVTPYGEVLPGDSTTPSAPPVSEDKDLPPSYSSLFPGR